MRKEAIVPIVLAIAFSISFLAASGSYAVKPDTQPEASEGTQWRFLIYMVADNNLDVSAGRFHVPVVEDDFRELMSVGSTDSVVCYVFVDRWAGPANLFKIHEGWMEEMTAFPLNGIEADMGDPAALRSFVEYTYAATPAEHTVLMFWDHGSPNIICWDDNGPAAGVGDALTHHEAIEALKGYKVDIIGADECLVGQIEVAYEYSVSGLDVDYLLASETYTGWRGYPYDQVFREMVLNPYMSPRECAVMFVEQVDILLSQTPYMSEMVNCHAAIDLAMVRTLVEGFQNVTAMITPDMADFVQAIAKARGTSTFQYGAGAIGIIDFRNFVETLMLSSPSVRVSKACSQVLYDFDQTVIALQDTKALEGFVHGLGIQFPKREPMVPDYYWDYAFGKEGWIDFMKLFWSVQGPGKGPSR